MLRVRRRGLFRPACADSRGPGGHGQEAGRGPARGGFPRSPSSGAAPAAPRPNRDVERGLAFPSDPRGPRGRSAGGSRRFHPDSPAWFEGHLETPDWSAPMPAGRAAWGGRACPPGRAIASERGTRFDVPERTVTAVPGTLARTGPRHPASADDRGPGGTAVPPVPRGPRPRSAKRACRRPVPHPSGFADGGSRRSDGENAHLPADFRHRAC